jgi:hypothetical protein
MEQRTDGPEVVVETNLDEVVDRNGKAFGGSYRVHARSRFRARKPEPEMPRAPEFGDPWCDLTVRARLERGASILDRMPHTPDTKPGGYRCSMPEIIRERWKDEPDAVVIKLGVSRADSGALVQFLNALIALPIDQHPVWWGIANKRSDRRVGRELRCDGKTAATRKQELLAFLAEDWNKRGWKPEDIDVTAARLFIHKNLD